MAKWFPEDEPEKPLLQLFSDKSECVYTHCFCEENVWKLCEDVSKRHESELDHCHVVFVSNRSRSVPLWQQRVGQREDKLVIWDFHVFFIYAPDKRAVVYDLDSALPFPTYFLKYAIETFRAHQVVRPEYHRQFRVVPAREYLENFASDRVHMKDKDGYFMAQPPDYPPIFHATSVNNLESFINMTPGMGFGVVMTYEELYDRFYKPPPNESSRRCPW